MKDNETNPELTDIRDITVDKNLPQRERIVEFVRQIKDPYHYKCGDMTITAVYSENGLTFEKCLQQIFSY